MLAEFIGKRHIGVHLSSKLVISVVALQADAAAPTSAREHQRMLSITLNLPGGKYLYSLTLLLPVKSVPDNSSKA